VTLLPARARGRFAKGPLVAAALAVAVCLVLIAIVRILPDAAPADDFAVLDLHLLDARHEAQLTGPYSRHGWHHPGPAIFYLLGPPYWLSGYRHMAAVLGAAAVNAGAIVALLAIVRRQAAGPGLLVASVAVLGLFVARSWGLLASPWNPHLPMLPLALLVVAAAGAAAGAYRLIPIAALLASFVAQTHVGFAGVAAAIGLTAAVLIVARQGRGWWRARAVPPPFARAVAVAALVTVALWTPPALDALAPGGGGNLQQIVRFFAEGGGPVSGAVTDAAFARYATAPVGESLSLPFGVARVGDERPVLSVLVRAQVLLVALAGGYWWIRRRAFEASLATVSLAASSAAWASVRQLPELPFDHTVYWVSVLGVINWAVIAAPVLAPIARRVARGTSVRAARLAWGATVAAAILTAGWQAAWWHARLERTSVRVVRMTDLARGEMARAGAGTVRLQFSHGAWGLTAGVALQLARTGARPTVGANWVWMFGSRQAPTGTEPLTLFIATIDDHREDYLHRSNVREVGHVEDVTLYAVGPAPPSRVVNRPLELTDAVLASPADAARLPERAGGQPKPPVHFHDAGAFVTFDLPATEVIGVRLRGEPNTVWQLRCAGPDGAFDRIGRVRLAAGPEPQWGETFPRTLAGCRQIKVAPAEHRPMWLDQLELLEPAPPGGPALAGAGSQ
jgi:hypothetical protein